VSGYGSGGVPEEFKGRQVLPKPCGNQNAKPEYRRDLAEQAA
jgi:hypothetical protein